MRISTCFITLVALITVPSIQAGKSKRPGRRNLETEPTLDFDDEDLSLESCQDQIYDLNLLVDATYTSHLYLFAQPSVSNHEPCLEPLGFDDNDGSKEIVGMHLKSEAEMVPLGSFSLESMLRASESAQVVKSEEYEVVVSNVVLRYSIFDRSTVSS